MDRPKTQPARRRKWPIVIALSTVAIAALLLASVRPVGAAADRSSLVTDTATLGTFIHEVAAPGALAAVQTRLLSAPAAGRVETVHVQNGDPVTAGQPVITLVNRDVVEELLEMEQQLAVAEAERTDLESAVQVRLLDNEKMLRRTEFEMRDAQRQAEAATQLAQEGLTSELERTRAREAATELAGRAASEKERHVELERSAAAQLQAQRNRIERLRALHAFRKSLVESLVIRTPSDGTIREVLVQPGESVADGQRVARLVEPGRLKAVLQVPEASALEVRNGQPVTLNARGMRLVGSVERVGATVEQGTIAVDVQLEGDLPAGLRPDLSVDGRIEIRRLANVISIARPANADANTSGALYRVDRDGASAHRVEVRYGPASIDRIVVAAGAAAGDHFIVGGLDGRSDRSIRLK